MQIVKDLMTLVDDLKDNDPELRAKCLIASLMHLGDNDESANKHIGYALAALKNGKTSVTQALDYFSVGRPYPNIDIDNLSKEEVNKLYKLYNSYIQPDTGTQIVIWEKIYDIIKEIGIDKIIEIDSQTSWGYVNFVLKLHY